MLYHSLHLFRWWVERTCSNASATLSDPPVRERERERERERVRVILPPPPPPPLLLLLPSPPAFISFCFVHFFLLLSFNLYIPFLPRQTRRLHDTSASRRYERSLGWIRSAMQSIARTWRRTRRLRWDERIRGKKGNRAVKEEKGVEREGGRKGKE